MHESVPTDWEIRKMMELARQEAQLRLWVARYETKENNND